MKIRMKTIAAGPGFNASPRQVVDRPEEEARRLVAGGFAEFVDEPAAAKPPAPIVEDATAQPEAETAEAPEGKKGRKGR